MQRLLICFPLAALLTAASAPTGVIEQRIITARQSIVKNETAPQGYNDLAFALVRRARETADPKYCEEAGTAASESLKLDAAGLAGRKAQAVVMLCQHRWAEARTELTALNKRTPDDVMIWGYLADAEMALGDYPAAEKSVQTMLDLRQVNPQGLARGAELRLAFGFNDPAIEWWNSASRLTSSSDYEERAWIETRIAAVHRMLGHFDVAEAACQRALALVPDYPWGLQEHGSNQLVQKKYADAVTTFTLLTKTAPAVTGALFELGLAQEAAGDSVAAQKTMAEFERRARAEAAGTVNANLALIRYYAGPGKRPAEAVRVAALTLQVCQDIETREAAAVAFAAAGDFKAANEQMVLALKPGINNPTWLLEAGRFAQKAGDLETAHKYFQRGLEAAPGSPLATEMIQALTTLPKAGS